MATNFITQGGVTQPGQRLGKGAVDALHVSEYASEVDGTVQNKSVMREFVNMKPITGTSTLTNDRVGEATLQAVGRGAQRPDPTGIEFANISVKVDTIILARDTMPLLDEFQSRIDVRMEMGKEHGKQLAKDFDQTLLLQGVKSAQKDDTGQPKGWVGGTTATYALADIDDGVKLLEAIEDLVTAMEEKEIDIEECALFLRPAQYQTLIRNPDLVDRDLSEGNGHRANRYIMKASGLPIVKTNRLFKTSTAARLGAGHEKLSNAANGYAYDVTTQDARCLALILHPKSLLAGETIPLTSKVYYVEQELQWFVDSYLSYGVTPNRADHTAALFLDSDWP